MKPIIRRLFVLFVAALLVAALAACSAVYTGGSGDGNEDATAQGEGEPGGATEGTASESGSEPEATEPEVTEPEVTTAPATTGGCAHVWDEGRIVTSPDCSHTGLRLLTCTVCGEKMGETVPKTADHKLSFSYLAGEPTATISMMTMAL